MENNVVTFITENIFLFLPLVTIGIVTTLYLYITGTRDGTEKKDDLDADSIVLAKVNVNVYVLIYLFIFVMMIIIGLLSNFVIPVLIGGIFASIPIIMMCVSKLKQIVYGNDRI
jgi:hypothetical protein